MKQRIWTLEEHLSDVKAGKRRFENVFESLTRMIGSQEIETKMVRGSMMYDYSIFRKGDKPVVGMFNEIASLVSYIQDAAAGGMSAEKALILIGEPANGKTYLIDYTMRTYGDFLRQEGNERYSFRFKNLSELGSYSNIKRIESQSFEDPMILAMNLEETEAENKQRLTDKGFSDDQIDTFWRNYRPLGACSEFILNQIREKTGGKADDMLEYIDIFKVNPSSSQGTVMTKITNQEKNRATSVEMIGEEEPARSLMILDHEHPYMFNLRKGAIGRAGGGGMHFTDELFKNPTDLVNKYLDIVQSRKIQMAGASWPIDAFIVATSNNTGYEDMASDPLQGPLMTRFHPIYVGHNTNYLLQSKLTSYALGKYARKTLGGESIHDDPNLNFAASVGVVLTRLPAKEKFDPVAIMKLDAGEEAGEHSFEKLAELIGELGQQVDVNLRYGQTGIGHRGLGEAILHLSTQHSTKERKCRFAKDVFDGIERVINDRVREAEDRNLFKQRLRIAKGLYRANIKTSIFNAYMEDPEAIKTSVLQYVNSVIGIGKAKKSNEKLWAYNDPITGEKKTVKVDEKYVKSVEDRMGLKNSTQVEQFRQDIFTWYVHRMTEDPNYDFMDNVDLVKAVTDVRVDSNINNESSLMGALANPTNEENMKLRTRMIGTMVDQLHYCEKCALETIEYYIDKKDEQ